LIAVGAERQCQSHALARNAKFLADYLQISRGQRDVSPFPYSKLLHNKLLITTFVITPNYCIVVWSVLVLQRYATISYYAIVAYEKIA
jgi:hypothetical protein